ncbi:trimethylamine methyltransferase family protein [Gaiella sp.]|uniref:trimethylamine methyltransferase family protein n=1 Tax=Gaiella sp. TaxID=2663207 RepID=UPI0032637D1E
MVADSADGHSRGGRSSRVERAERRAARARPSRFVGTPPQNALGPVALLADDQLAAVHDASLDLLQETGVEFMGAAARSAFASAGALVDDETGVVRIPREVVQHALGSVPAQFVVTPRNPTRRLEIGGDRVAFGLVAGPPTVHDRVRGRRTGNLDDYITLVKLAQCFDIIHFIGNQPTSPQELPVSTRHLDTYLANLTYTDRTFHCLAIGRERTIDGIEMMAISRGLTLEEVIDDPCVLTIISVNSPRRFDEAMTDGLMAMAEHGQPAVITPFTLMGAMTPVTLAAALVQQNAEALAGITLTQLVRPGAPVVYGAFTSNVDLRSGAPAFGTPENARATIAAGQLARHYRIPYRASNASASNAVDAQAAYESQMSIWSSILGGAHLVYHGAGWMEGGLTASFEKLVIDVEMLQMIAATIAPADVSTTEIEAGLAAISEVATGGHFFGSAHTLARYETAFYEPLVSNWQNYESWEEAGSLTADVRATRVWQEALERYEQPPLDADVEMKLAAYVARRKIELRDVDH